MIRIGGLQSELRAFTAGGVRMGGDATGAAAAPAREVDPGVFRTLDRYQKGSDVYLKLVAVMVGLVFVLGVGVSYYFVVTSRPELIGVVFGVWGVSLPVLMSEMRKLWKLKNVAVWTSAIVGGLNPALGQAALEVMVKEMRE